MSDQQPPRGVRGRGDDILAEMARAVSGEVSPSSEAEQNLSAMLNDPDQHNGYQRQQPYERKNQHLPRKPRLLRDAQGNIIEPPEEKFGETDAHFGREISNFNQSSRHVEINDPLPTDHEREITPGLKKLEQLNKPASYESTRTNQVVESAVRVRTITANYRDLDLPSNMQPYKFDSVKMRKFGVPEFQLIADWEVSQNDDFILDAIDATLSTSIYDLTIQDGIYLMYYHRDFSFPKSPYMMEWECKPVHFGNVEHPGCGFKNLTQLKHPNLHLRTLDEIGFDYSLLDERLDLPRMRHYKEFVRLQKDLVNYAIYRQQKMKFDLQTAAIEAGTLKERTVEEPQLPTLHFPYNQLQVYQAALYMREGNTLEEKKNILTAQEDGELMQTALNLSRNVLYGVQEAALVTCQQCGAERSFRLLIEPASFVP